jgi:hypothetical protein
MPKTLYVDESGDLGFGGAGSSKYLTILYLATENTPRLKVLVRRAQKRYGLPRKGEIKGTNLTQEQREDFLKRLVVLPDIEIGAVVITKQNVYPHLREKGKQNLLYAWAAGQVIIPYLARHDNCHVIWDERTFKTRYGLTIDSYFSVQLAVKHKSGHNFRFEPQLSETRLGLQAADVVANTIWRKYENGDARAYPLIEAKIIDEFKLI